MKVLSHKRPGVGTPAESQEGRARSQHRSTQDPRSAPAWPLLAQALALRSAGEPGWIASAHFFPGGGSLREERIPGHKSNGV